MRLKPASLRSPLHVNFVIEINGYLFISIYIVWFHFLTVAYGYVYISTYVVNYTLTSIYTEPKREYFLGVGIFFL